MLTYNVGFVNSDSKEDETQLDIHESVIAEAEVVELINLILSLKDEMGIQKIIYIEDAYEEE